MDRPYIRSVCYKYLYNNIFETKYLGTKEVVTIITNANLTEEERYELIVPPPSFVMDRLVWNAEELFMALVEVRRKNPCRLVASYGKLVK